MFEIFSKEKYNAKEKIRIQKDIIASSLNGLKVEIGDQALLDVAIEKDRISRLKYNSVLCGIVVVMILAWIFKWGA
jgi:hypothetical protein